MRHASIFIVLLSTCWHLNDFRQSMSIQLLSSLYRLENGLTTASLTSIHTLRSAKIQFTLRPNRWETKQRQLCDRKISTRSISLSCFPTKSPCSVARSQMIYRVTHPNMLRVPSCLNRSRNWSSLPMPRTLYFYDLWCKWLLLLFCWRCYCHCYWCHLCLCLFSRNPQHRWFYYYYIDLL